MTSLWRHWAADDAASPAVTVDERTITRGELRERTNRLARALAARGVAKGDFVAIGLPTSLEFVELIVASLKIGATPLPLSHRLPRRERDEIVALAEPRVVIDYRLDEAGGLELEPDLDPLVHSAEDLDDMVAPAYKAAASGGSTGRPKIIVSGLAAEVPLDPESGLPVTSLRIAPGEACLFPGPLYHNTALLGTIMCLSAGGHVVLESRYDAELTLRLVERHRVRTILMVPTHMNRIWRLDPEVRDSYDLSSLRILRHNGAACPPDLKRSFIDWLGADRIFENYTSTEQTAMAACDGHEWLDHPGTVGRVVVGEMRVLDDQGDPVAPGEVGSIWMRRPAGAPPTYRYLGAEAVSRPGGWETFGDLGSMDEDGYLFIADRGTDLILRGGANIYPAEVESALSAHPDVLDCIVIGLPDSDLGSTVHAIVQLRPDATADEQSLRAHVAEYLAPYKTPSTYEFVSAPLRDDGGKARRSALREERVRARAGQGTDRTIR